MRIDPDALAPRRPPVDVKAELDRADGLERIYAADGSGPYAVWQTGILRCWECGLLLDRYAERCDQCGAET